MLTITEALAEIKTIDKRVEVKRNTIISTQNLIARVEGFKDPFIKEGGSAEYIRRELQGINDLTERKVALRQAIQKKNQTTELTIEGKTRTVAAWLTWRKEVSSGEQSFLTRLRSQIASIRVSATQKGLNIVQNNATPQKDNDLIINVDEAELAQTAESMETILGSLDGRLSLLNATLMIEV